MEPSLWRMLTSLGDTDIGLEDLRDIGDVLLGSGEGGMGESGGMLAKYLWKRNVSQSQTDIGYVDVNQKKYLSWHWFWCSESIYHPKFSWYITLRWHQFSLLMTLTIQKLFTRLTYVFKKFSHTTNELWYAYSFYTWLYLARYSQLASWLQIQSYSVVSIKITGSLNYFEVFYHPEPFFHVLNEIYLPPWSFFHVLNEIFALPCSLITSCLLNRYYRVSTWANARRSK